MKPPGWHAATHNLQILCSSCTRLPDAVVHKRAWTLCILHFEYFCTCDTLATVLERSKVAPPLPPCDERRHAMSAAMQ